MKALLLLTLFTPGFLAADTIAHWKFDGRAGKKLDDETRNHPLTATSEEGPAATPTAYVFNGSDKDGLLSAADHADWNKTSMTVEAFVKKGNDDGFACITGHFKGDIGDPSRQWIFVLKNTIPTLILQSADGKTTEIPADVPGLLLDHEYYLGVSFDLSEKNPEDRITFYVKDLTARTRPVRVKAAVEFQTLSTSSAPLSVGSTGNPTSRFIGEIGEIRISSPVLKTTQLLLPK
ncbi:hypothetical protein OVA24_14690 [Luteolibacter sp. SL250]|uniref:hypothetical protein n=1 Tax=Luteolibacter sp. SL250 TaxID=2995170 RepID=UPI00226E5D8E|nr:hypothetical protein [Luteolibacter sp. SL250]WAC18480.1 hypothetical protein OVA24_14690 [Luteolibacter sp. SL250]